VPIPGGIDHQELPGAALTSTATEILWLPPPTMKPLIVLTSP
jgi:hypothetical protein